MHTPMTNERLQYLFDRYIQGTCTPAEKNELAVLALVLQHEAAVQELLENYWYEVTAEMKMPDEKAVTVAAEILQHKPVVRKMGWRKIVAAAAVLIVTGLGIYFFMLKPAVPTETVKTVITTDVKAPETNRATITLADGSKLYLDSLANGTLATENNVSVVKLADGQIAYKGSAEKTVWNTLSNPRGSKVVDITLADGTQVWLNTGSSITYPVSFIGNERKVTVTGEAYFEVMHNPSKPFIVSNDEMAITVLGTHFNVNAYEDEEAITVTLLEGSVKTSIENGQSVVLKPGEQSIIHNSQLTVRNNTDLDAVMAWKNGLFSFKRADAKSIMRQVARWYDVEVEYEGEITAETISGEISRNANISEVMKMLEFVGLQVTIRGKKVMVSQ